MRQRTNETREEYLERCRLKQQEYSKNNREKERERYRKRYYKDIEKSRERQRAKYNKTRGDPKHFCCEDISLIENYELAKADNFVGWDLHHRLEIGAFYTISRDELKGLDLYFHRPANELLYIRHGEHTSLHMKRKKH